jgi:hypothetical protein
MLVSTIISNGRLLADVPNTTFYTDAEALFAVQLEWKRIYATLCDNDEDFFATSLYITSSSFTADANRKNVYTYTPTDFYRLRLLQYQGNGGDQYTPAYKMTVENFGNTMNTPGYRVVGQSINIYDPDHWPNWCIWYYPQPVTLTTSTDLIYPLSMIPEIMAYQVAVEIRRKQNIDFKPKQERRDEMWKAMEKQMHRDEAKAENTRNVFANGFAPYI